MGSFAFEVYALAVGLTVCGLTASLVQAAGGVRPGTVLAGRSGSRLAVVGLVVFAGPLMLFMLGLRAWRDGRVGRPAVAGCTASALIWAWAMGCSLVRGAELALQAL